MPPSYRVSHPRPSSHLTLHRGILYFRILVPNHLQSLLGKCEIRRSLNGLDSRTARSKALRLSLVAQHFFALSEDLVEERIHSVQDNISQQFGITKENIKSVGTFLFDSTLKKDLSPASLTLLLPSFLREQKGTLSIKIFSEKAAPVRKDPIQDKAPALRQEGKSLPGQLKQHAAGSDWKGKRNSPVSGTLLMPTSKPRRLHGQPQAPKTFPRRFASSWKL